MEYNILSKKLHEIRQMNSLQQKELADAIGINPNRYSCDRRSYEDRRCTVGDYGD
jgi:transcriptional regulator with XRE-family HTH domain